MIDCGIKFDKLCLVVMLVCSWGLMSQPMWRGERDEAGVDFFLLLVQGCCSILDQLIWPALFHCMFTASNS